MTTDYNASENNLSDGLSTRRRSPRKPASDQLLG